MNLRNTIRWEKEEEDKITFVFEWDWADCDVQCDGKQLANFLLNLLDIGKRMLDDTYLPAEVVAMIHKKWKADVKDLSKKK